MAVNSTIFISYSHKDERWKDRLVTHLTALQQESVDVWSDRRIAAGEDWLKEIRVALTRAQVAVLLVSADFLSSDFIRHEEIPSVLRRRKRGGLHVIPIIVRPCAWRAIDWLAQMQLRPQDGKPLNRGGSAHADSDLTDIALEVRALMSGAPTSSIASSVRPSQANRSPEPRPKGLASRRRNDFPSTSRSTVPGANRPSRPVEPRSISSTGKWILLNGEPFVASSVSERDGRDIIVQIPVASSAYGAQLGQIRTKYENGYAQFGYAYQDDASLVTLTSASRDSINGKTSWTLQLRRTENPNWGGEFAMNSWSADDIAQFRASRLLLGDTALPDMVRRDQFLMSSIESFSSEDRHDPLDIPDLWRRYGREPATFIRAARLHIVLALKLSRVCEHILKLTLGPITPTGLRIDFAGARHQAYHGKAPATITVKGTRPLNLPRR
jgi:hypothetical protein